MVLFFFAVPIMIYISSTLLEHSSICPSNFPQGLHLLFPLPLLAGAFEAPACPVSEPTPSSSTELDTPSGVKPPMMASLLLNMVQLPDPLEVGQSVMDFHILSSSRNSASVRGRALRPRG